MTVKKSVCILHSIDAYEMRSGGRSQRVGGLALCVRDYWRYVNPQDLSMCISVPTEILCHDEARILAGKEILDNARQRD